MPKDLVKERGLRRLETTLPGVWEIRPRVFIDSRGFFIETYHRQKFSAIGINDLFVQDNHSCSSRNTLRGLHYQLNRPQAKLCRVIEGQALDIVVDIRVGSPFFGKWTSVLLSSDQENQVYVPSGFAHGFLALTDKVHFLYKCSAFYDPGDEHGVLWSDPDLHIEWTASSPVISEKDRTLPRLAAIAQEFLPRYTAK